MEMRILIVSVMLVAVFCIGLSFRHLSNYQSPEINRIVCAITDFDDEIHDMFIKDEESLTGINIKLSLYWPPSGHVYILVPLRGRRDIADLFSTYMHIYLKEQNQSHTVLFIEQSDNLPFNRGQLFNIGFSLASNYSKWDQPRPTHVALHDVDLLPFFNAPYGYPDKGPPLTEFYQLSSSMSHMNWGVAYPGNCGGVNLVTTEAFANINGFSNRFWGWGGEDDNLLARLRFKTGLEQCKRPPREHGRFIHVKHPPQLKTGRNGKFAFSCDENCMASGLSDLNYSLVSLNKEKYCEVCFTAVVKLIPDPDRGGKEGNDRRVT
jgi:hypothetical protein